MSKAKNTAKVLERLRSADLRDRAEALLRLNHDSDQTLDHAVIEALIDNLASPGKAVQRYAAGALAAAARHNPELTERLVSVLESEPAARWAAAYALGLIEGALDLRACGALIDALGNDDGDVRWAALDLTVRLARRYPEAMRIRLLEMQRRGDANSRKMALYAMRDLGLRDCAATAAACEACANPESEVRLAGLSFLKAAGACGPDALDAALNCLESDPNPGVRRAAAFTLGYLGARSERVLIALRKAAANHSDPSLCRSARLTLARLKEEA